MFEKYAETARRSVFFARYAASQLGCEYIEAGHLLLGVMRADPPLAVRVFKTQQQVESVRERIEKQSPPREKLSTSMDLPLSRECKRVLAHAASEAERLGPGQVSTGHLLLAVVLERECAASKIIAENGVTAADIERAITDDSSAPALAAVPPRLSTVPAGKDNPGYRDDLTAAAQSGTLNPLIGREVELESIMRILSRRTRRNPVLVGEPGVGKTAIVHGLAQRIADGAVPASLEGRLVLATDASSLVAAARNERHREITTPHDAILFVHGLFDLAGNSPGWGVLEAIHALELEFAHTGMQCIATGTPLGFRMTLEKAESLARHFEAVAVLPPNEEETIRIVSGVKEQYEKFHGVVITDEAIATAVSASRWFLRHRQLPDRAIDLIDEAGASVNLRREQEPGEITKIEKRIRRIVRDMEKAIVNHEFVKASAFSVAERQERQNLQRVREELGQATPGNVVNAEHVVAAVAGRAGVAPSVVRSMMQVRNVKHLGLVANELAAQISIGGREWTEALVAYLAGCSAEEAEQVALAIRAAKASIDEDQPR